MKKIFLLLIISSFLINNSCNTSGAKGIEENTASFAIINNESPSHLLKSLLNTNGKIIVNVVNSSQCFQCAPVFSFVSGYLQYNFPSGNIVYIFPTMRKVLQTEFLKDNLMIEAGTLRTIFNDDLYHFIQKQYSLCGNSALLCFENQQFLGSIVYDRTNAEEVIKFVSNI